MKTVRLHIVSKIVAVLTGIVFLNMSFFLTEIRMLNLHVTDHALVENIVKMMTGAGFEEEKDAFGESSEQGNSEQAIDFHLVAHASVPYASVLIADNLHFTDQSNLRNLATSETATPPPKRY
jgi:hypothetical protein